MPGFSVFESNRGIRRSRGTCRWSRRRQARCARRRRRNSCRAMHRREDARADPDFSVPRSRSGTFNTACSGSMSTIWNNVWLTVTRLPSLTERLAIDAGRSARRCACTRARSSRLRRRRAAFRGRTCRGRSRSAESGSWRCPSRTCRTRLPLSSASLRPAPACSARRHRRAARAAGLSRRACPPRPVSFKMMPLVLATTWASPTGLKRRGAGIVGGHGLMRGVGDLHRNGGLSRGVGCGTALPPQPAEGGNQHGQTQRSGSTADPGRARNKGSRDHGRGPGSLI